MIRKLYLAVILSVLACVGAHAADLNGIWKAQFDTPVGTQNYTFEFHVDGAKVTGKATNDQGSSTIQEGKCDGQSVAFVEQVSLNGMDLRIVYTGKIDGDTIHFVRKVGDFGTDEFNATRVR
jgi:hypothetical protein